MTTILSKHNGLMVYSFMVAEQVKELVILPDLNMNLDPKLVECAALHPVFKQHVLDRLIQIIESEPEIKGEKDGQKIVDLKDDEGLVATDAKEVSFKAEKYKPSEETLTQFKGVGVKTAKDILAKMPEDGWNSKEDFLKETKSYDIDWTKKK